MNRLSYKVASITFSISGESVKNLETYLISYKDFKIDEKNIDADIEFNIGCSINTDEFKSVFIENVGPVTFEQYRNVRDNSMMVRAVFKGKEHFVVISHDFRKAYTDAKFEDISSAYILDRFILITFMCRAIDFDIIKLHASSIAKDGKCIAFVGVSGTGKSTHSRLWLKHIEGSELVNDDEPFVRVLDDGGIVLYGAPWSGSAKCFKNKSYPLKAVVHLFQAKENKLTELSSLQSLDTMIGSVNSLPMYIGMRRKQIDIIYRIIDSIKVYKLECLPDFDAVNNTRKILDDEL